MPAGIGGTPEGITACVIKAFGRVIHGNLMLVDAPEQKQPLAAGHDLDRVLTTNDRVARNNTYFATGSPTATRPWPTPRRKRHQNGIHRPTIILCHHP